MSLNPAGTGRRSDGNVGPRAGRGPLDVARDQASGMARSDEQEVHGAGFLMSGADAVPRRIRVFVDADACPVKAETYRVAERYRLAVFVVSNSLIAIPRSGLVERVVVEAGPDVADRWIAERAQAGDVVVTSDVPLAAQCVKAGAEVLGPTGRRFDTDSIGMTLATRNLMEELRSAGEVTGGPRPFGPRDRSAFLNALDAAVARLRRAGFAAG